MREIRSDEIGLVAGGHHDPAAGPYALDVGSMPTKEVFAGHVDGVFTLVVTPDFGSGFAMPSPYGGYAFTMMYDNPDGLGPPISTPWGNEFNAQQYELWLERNGAFGQALIDAGNWLIGPVGKPLSPEDLIGFTMVYAGYAIVGPPGGIQFGGDEPSVSGN